MSYKLTPEQYKDAAQRRIDNPNTAENTNSAVSAYARMLNANRAMDNKNLQKQTKEPEDVALETDEEQDEPSWFRRVLSTITAPIVRFTEGVAKFVENTILDAGAGLIASVADLFGADETAKDIQSWAAQDIVGEAFDWEPIQNIYNNSYSNDWGKFGEILQEGIYAVGNQAIPFAFPFALNFIPGVGHAISATTYFVGGYGSGFESASQDGGSVLGASAYGLISAGLETAIEQGFGGAMKWGDKAGKGLKGVISKVAKSPAAQKAIGVVMDAAGEGAEEVVSGFLNNYIKAMTYQGDYSSVQSYFNNILNAEPATQEELLEQFFVGAMAGGMMTGAHSVVRMSSPSLNTRETIAEMDELREKGYNLNQRGKDTTATETEYAEKEADLVALVNKNLQKFEDKKANGNKDSAYILDYMDKNFNRDESGNFTTSKNGLVKTENVSYGTTEADIERAVTSQGNTVHNGALEGVSAQAKSNVEKALKNINKSLGKKRLNLVVADIAVKEDGTRDYGYLAGNTIVVDASMLGTDVEFTVVENDKPIKYKVEAGISTLLHEVFHVAEDTKAGKKLRDTLAQYAIDNDVETVNEIEGAYAKDSLKVQYSELSARQLEKLLFNEKIIHRLTEDNTTLAKRVLHKAERLLNALKGENLNETKSVETLLKKTIKLYNKAIVQVGKGKTYQVVSRKELDKEEKIEYSRRTAKYISYNAIGRANVQAIREELTKLYDGVEDGIADGVAIEHGNTIYIVDSGKDNGELSFGVRKRKTIQDAKLRAEVIRRINNESISKGRISYGLSSRIGDGYDNDSGRDLRRELGEELSSNTRQSPNNQGRISSNNGYRRVRRITDSNGELLTNEQAEYFKDSKVLDENGNLLVLYRSADGGRTVWDGRTNTDLQGVFLTDNEHIARAFAGKGREIIEVYADIRNPLILDAQGRIYTDIPISSDAPSWLKETYSAVETADLDTLPKHAFEHGYDGIIVYNVKEGVGGGPATDIVVKNSNQIKLTSNKTPTSNEDIRYSRRINKEQNNERSDEFRRIQEESLAMSDGELQAFRNGSKKLDGELRNRLVLVFGKEIHASRTGGDNRPRLLKNTGEYSLYESVEPSLFHDCFEIVRRYLKYGELVDLHAVETTEDGIGYEDCTNYLSDDGLSGFSITPDGDLISVFNASGKGKFLRAISEIVSKNAKTLDCYNSSNQPLAGMYAKHFGFKPASIMDYNMEYDHDDIAKNHGKPKVYFMVNTDAVVETKPFTETQYDEAVAYQQSFVKDNGIRHSRRIISREDVSNAVEDTLNMLTAIGNIDENSFDVSLESKNKLLSVYVTQLKEQAVNGRLTEKSKTVKNLVNAIFDNAVLTENYVDDLGESAMLLTSLRPYLHSIDLSAPSIKADVQQRYGKQNNIFRLWGKKNGGVAWDSALQAILEDVPALAVDTDGQGNNEISTLFNVFDSYTKAVADMKKQRASVSSVVRNADEVKRYMARQLVLSLNESGTELVTKLTADKLQSIINEERNALQETLRAVKNGESEIAFQGQNLSAKAKQQLGEIVEVISKERASVYAEKQADMVVSHIKKGVTAEEMRDVRKTESYKKMSEYIAERRLQESKEISIKSIEEGNPTAVFGLKQAITSVRNVRTLESGNANVLKQIRDMDTTLLKQRAQELTLEETPITLIDELHEAVNALYKKTEDGKRKMLTYKEMISSGGLKNLTSVFRNYCADGNPIIQDLKDSGMFDGVVERLEAYEKYVEALDAEAYANMSLMERQTFHNAFAMFLAEVVRATKPTTNITVDGKTVSMKKYRDKSLRSIASSLKRDRNGKIRDGKRGFAAFSAKFFQESVRPFEAIAMAENYAGALETLYQEVRTGAIKGETARADLEDLIYNFLDDKNNKVNGKKYDSVLTSQEVTIKHSQGEFVITKGELIGLYLTLIQEDGFMHADANNPMAEGIYFDDKEKSTDYRNKTALKFTAENVVEMEKLLNEKDLLFIEKVREFFAEAGKLKAEVDMYLYGMERLLGEDYYPLRTDESARTSKLGDKVAFYEELDPSGHLSINQSRTFGINALRVGNVLDVLTSYAKSVGLYYGVAIPVADMRLVYNSKGAYGDSIKTTIAKYSMKSFDEYLDKLLFDVQGAIKVSDSFLERQRQRYASFAVAANIKSPIKALGGLFSLSGRFKTTAFLKGMTISPFSLIKSGKVDFSQMYEYCPATRIRYRDKQATLAAMNVERGSRAKNKLVDTLAIGIELVDKYTVYVAWNSAKAEVGAVGDNANNPELLKKAGKLLDEALDTIDRFEMTERNAFSRSEDSFRRGLAMFTSSAQAQLTQFIDKTFRLIHLYNQKKHLPLMIQEANDEKAKYAQLVADEERAVEKAKQNGDKDMLRNAEYRLRKAKAMLNDKTMLISELYQKQATIDKDIKKAKLFTKKAIVSISLAIVVSAALSKLMDRLMGKDDEEEESGTAFLYGMLDESLSNVFGMLPLVGQFYNALEFNIGEFEKKSYDMSFWVIDEWNALADALNGFVALMDGSGTKSPARVARDFAYALGQWFGIPTRNLFNAMNTVLQVSPSAHYAVNDWFSKGNYGSDLKKAIDSKDTELADTIVRLMMKDTFGDTDTKVVKTVRSLYEQGYTGVIPKTVSSSITINGESYEMTKKQQAAFKRTYSQADTAIEKLIGKQSFTTLSAKVQADSIKWIYDYYYQKAKEELTGIEDDSKKALFGSYINVETLAVAYSYCKSLEADTDKKGKIVTGTRKAKVVKYLNSLRLTAAEKYMILGYLGYSPVNNNAEMMITAFARKNGASKTEIEELLAMCNIAA